MAKDSASTRIPRLDGVSRLPLPSNIRPPAKLQRAAQQLLRPSTAVGTPRPLSHPTGRQGIPTFTANAISQENGLRKTTSGERLNNAFNLVGQKSTNALKKLFGGGRTDKALKQQQQLQAQQQQQQQQQQQRQQKQQYQRQQFIPKPTIIKSPEVHSNNNKTQILSKDTLARSSTFIRDDSSIQHETVNVPHNLLVQSTPASSTFIVCPVSETTPLLSYNTMRPAINKTLSLDATTLINSTASPILCELNSIQENKLLKRTHTLEHSQASADGTLKPLMGETQILNNTVCLNSPLEQPLDATCTVVNPHNETRIVSTPELLRNTVCSNKSREYLEKSYSQLTTTDCTQILNSSQLVDKLNNVNDVTKIIGHPMQDLTAPVSPATNATYSNPGSMENLQMLEDVSMPSGLDLDVTLQSQGELNQTLKSLNDKMIQNLDETQTSLGHTKTNMRLALNSTMNTERLLDLTTASTSTCFTGDQNRLTGFKDFLMASPQQSHKNTSQLLYMTQTSISATTTPEKQSVEGPTNSPGNHNLQYLVSPFLLKGAQSEVALPTRSPEELMDLDSTIVVANERTEQFFGNMKAERNNDTIAMSLQDVNNPIAKQKGRQSFGSDLIELSLDCSIDLVDASLSSTAPLQFSGNQTVAVNDLLSPSTQQMQPQQQHQQLVLKKQNSFEFDESLGILTPDQMKELLDSTATNNTNNLELPLNLQQMSNSSSHKVSMHQMRVDQTPSPEELPLDPVEVKTDISDLILSQQQQQQAALQTSTNTQYSQQMLMQSTSMSTEPISLHTDTDLSKADPMTKSNVSKISTSFITSVTSVTSLDTGYQGDGEMSRPASREASDHSESNGPTTRKIGSGGFGHVSRQPSFQQQQPVLPPIRRQDPMTDSDFFTESDADDIFHRGDRRAQVIDGQLYGPTFHQGAASVFITEDPQMEDCCMESSGIFTDVENRCDEDLAEMRHQDTQEAIQDLSPDGEGDHSTETVRSNREKLARLQLEIDGMHTDGDGTGQGQGANGVLSSSQTSSTIQSSFSTDRLSAAPTLSNRTSYCSVDGSSSSANAFDCKSFLSLDEALALGEHIAASSSPSCSSTTSAGGDTKRRIKSIQSATGSSGNSTIGCGGGKQLNSSAVQRGSSPRKHASLTSLSSRSRNKSAIASASSSSSVQNSSANNTSGGLKSTSASVGRKSQTPNKWDAVMNKIASNKALMKKNYNEVKSKVSTRLNMPIGGSASASASVSASASASGRATAASSVNNGGATPNSSAGSMVNTPTVRRSPSLVHNANVMNGRAAVSPSVAAKVLSNSNKMSSTSSASGASTPKDNNNTPANGLHAKRLLQTSATVKRGRSYSKDSQKSSQSDLSLASGSPKLLAKTPLRAAKKRDVRNLSISPTDLGPPPKTQQTVNGTSTRPKTTVVTLTQRRISSSPQSSPHASTPTRDTTIPSINTPSAAGSLKGSPPPKKLTITRRLDTKAATRAVVKEHNRIGAPPALATVKNATGKQQDIPTELQELRQTLHNNNNTIDSALASEATTPATSPTASDGVAKSKPAIATVNEASAPALPLLAQKNASRKIGGNISGTPIPPVAAVVPEKKTQGKSTRKSIFNKKQSHPTQLAEPEPLTKMEATPAHGTVFGEFWDAWQHLKLLNRFLTNGTLDFNALEKHLQSAELMKQEKRLQDTSIQALGVLLNYLVHDLDAFACPSAKSEAVKVKQDLTRTMQMMNETKSMCSELQDQLSEKENYYQQREEELQAMHRCELEKAKATLLEYELHAKEQVSLLETQQASKNAEFHRNFECFRMEMDSKLQIKNEQLEMAQKRTQELEERLSAIESSEANLRDELKCKEKMHQQKLEEAAEQEQCLMERIKVLTMELDTLKGKLNLSQDEVAILRTSRKSLQGTPERSSLNNSMSPRNSSSSEITRLESEAESLRCVLELKQKEISKLTKQNEELMRDANERLTLQNKLSLLESQNELLRLENEKKAEREKDYIRQFDEMRKAFNHESVKRTRLVYDYETLQWQLKQRSEQLHIVESKLQELSTNESLNLTNPTSFLGGSGVNSRTSLFNDTSMVQGDEMSSPQHSPVAKSLITKAGSMSWVLQMDDESPETAASKMVRRSGTFRASDRNLMKQRQLSLSATATSSSNGTTNGVNGSGSGSGPHPLSQSMSAASVIRQHSSESTNGEFPTNRANARVRSKSMSVRQSEAGGSAAPKNGKKHSRVHTNSSKHHELGKPSAWKDPLSASSPYNSIRPRTSTNKMIGDEAVAEGATTGLTATAPLFRRSSSSSSSSRTLITCDTSALESGERLEMGTLPTHANPHHHDLKLLKKWQEIQESAGEAMVSGTNSEDEGCSASSDELVSSASTASVSASAASGSNSSLHAIKNCHMFDMLMMEKVDSGSLEGTPMECSWSEDIEGLPNCV